MSLVPNVGRKSPRIRIFIGFVYAVLTILGITMVVPFLITLSSSTTNDMDYYRFSPIPRYFYSGSDRFMKGLVYYFNGFKDVNWQMRANIPDMPKYWTNWSSIGKDIPNIDRLAEKYYYVDSDKLNYYKIQAADYSEFCDSYPLDDTTVTIIDPQGVEFVEDYYIAKYKQTFPEKAKEQSSSEIRQSALDLLNTEWGVAFDSFFSIKFTYEKNAPLGFQSFFLPVENPKYQAFLKLKNAYRSHFFTPGVKSAWLSYLSDKQYEYENEDQVFPVYDDAQAGLKKLWGEFKKNDAPASSVIPYAMRTVWYKYLRSEDASRFMKFASGQKIDIDKYNELAGTEYKAIEETPFPLPESYQKKFKGLWDRFLQERFPLRLTRLNVTPELEKQFQSMLKKDIKLLSIANELLKTQNKRWEDFKLLPTPPLANSEKAKNYRNLWINFTKKLPYKKRIYSCSEMAYQNYLKAKYQSVDVINKKYGWKLKHLEEAFPPFIAAYAITLHNHETAFTVQPVFYNYKVIAKYLFINARAIPVTFVLIVLTIACTLTINPLAAYSLSRFNLRGQSKVLLFMLATMAFPAMVSAIPAYLLMRDLNLLNTFWALVLPGAANGMAIFVLKGFFDSLPQELFEAATIDGASEMQIFRIVAMPMVKPILAIKCLNAFIIAYNGWQWALIICQDKDMWTIAVWLYQASMWWSGMPWIVSAGFIIASIPTFIFFISCQRIILKGIVIPSMK